MPADLNKPASTDHFLTLLADLRDLLGKLAKMDMSSVSNVPTGAKQWSDANGRFEKFDGSSWVALLSNATTSIAGLALLSNSTTSTSETMAATSKAVKDLADSVLKLNGSSEMSGPLDLGDNDINGVGTLRAGATQQMRAGFWGGKGQIFCSAGGLSVGSDGAGENVNVYAKDAGGTSRVVLQVKEDGDIVCYGNMTFNNGTIMP